MTGHACGLAVSMNQQVAFQSVKEGGEIVDRPKR